MTKVPLFYSVILLQSLTRAYRRTVISENSLYPRQENFVSGPPKARAILVFVRGQYTDASTVIAWYLTTVNSQDQLRYKVWQLRSTFTIHNTHGVVPDISVYRCHNNVTCLIPARHLLH